MEFNDGIQDSLKVAAIWGVTVAATDLLKKWMGLKGRVVQIVALLVSFVYAFFVYAPEQLPSGYPLVKLFAMAFFGAVFAIGTAGIRQRSPGDDGKEGEEKQ